MLSHLLITCYILFENKLRYKMQREKLYILHRKLYKNTMESNVYIFLYKEN